MLHKIYILHKLLKGLSTVWEWGGSWIGVQQTQLELQDGWSHFGTAGF